MFEQNVSLNISCGIKIDIYKCNIMYILLLFITNVDILY